MFYTLRPVGIGALPATPSAALTVHGGLLKPNHQWVRYYEVDMQHQLRVCPKNPPFGCWIVDGYAWGQREWYPDEFAPHGFTLKPLPPPFPHPPAAKPKPKVTAKPAPKPAAPVRAPVPTTVAKKGATPTPTAVAPQRPVAPQVQPRVTTVTPATVPDVMPARHEMSGVGALVGVGLFVAIGLTLLR